jgi:hypothetical protein
MRPDEIERLPAVAARMQREDNRSARRGNVRVPAQEESTHVVTT